VLRQFTVTLHYVENESKMEKHIGTTDFKQDIQGYSMHLTGEIRMNH